MEPFESLLKCIAQAAWNAAGDGILTESLTDVLPEIAGQAWADWSKVCSADQRRAALEGLVQAPIDVLQQAAETIAADLARSKSATVRQGLADYLVYVPAIMRQAFRRPTDAGGTTMPSRLSVEKADDLIPFLPMRRPRFRPGDSPLAGVDWELEELLGVREFGEVWKARNPHLPSAPAVALKFFFDTVSAKVLRNEAKLLDRLMLQGRHPGIVPLRQTYLTGEPPCLEYEFVASGNLATTISEWHRLRQGPTPGQIARIVLRLSKILAFTHRLDPPLVHRDLKPANVLVHRQADASLSLRIADFGSGGTAASAAIRQALRGVSPAQLQLAAARGACTALYASPQQMQGVDPDPRDDVHALGVIWHQFLTGDLTSGRPSGTRWSRRLADQGMAAPLIELLGSCFEENPDARPRNAGVLADQLAALLQDKEQESNRSVAAPAPAAPYTRRVTNSLGMTLVLVPAGTYWMGSPVTEAERGTDEGPQHEVTITRPFFLGMYPVTQRQYETVTGENPSYFTHYKGGGPEHPVERISWEDAVAFCRKLSELPAEKAAGRVYRLPTEAEWEYACRAGSSMPFASGMVLSSREANFNGNYPYGQTNRGPYLERTSKVGSFAANAFGLYDMHGNVWEWCSDFYDRSGYKNSPRYDPAGPATGILRVVRGGSCVNIGRFCRAAYRFGVAPTNRDHDVGMRMVMVLNGEGPI
jgi:formylglycine-generating enzyme required for sulfatase activity